MATNDQSLERINLEETKKGFEAFSQLTDQQLEKRFKISSWDYINNSEIRAVHELLDFTKDSPMLEVGCGTGRLILPIEDKMTIYGLDFSRSFLEKLRKNTKKIQLVEGSAENLPFNSQSLNSVLCVRVIQHLSPRQQQAVIKEIARVLKPGGSLVMLNYNSWSLLTLYKILCMKLYRFWPHWPL